MQHDVDKFNAETMRILAISCMSPFGIFVLNILVNYNYESNWFLFFRIIICIIAFIAGLFIYIKALDIMDQRDRMMARKEIKL